MALHPILVVLITLFISIPLTYWLTKRKLKSNIDGYKSILEALSMKQEELISVKKDLKKAKLSFFKIDRETRSLQSLKENSNQLMKKVRENIDQLKQIKSEIADNLEKKAQ